MVNMKTSIWLGTLTLSLALLLSSCANKTTVVETSAAYPDYGPGFTGYTVGDDAYGNYYNDGYGPSFWTPRYFYYTGYNNGAGGYYAR
jgi:hypothetical protein